jgi:hypothetical protein
MGNWIQVDSDDQIQICSLMLQTSRPRYNGHLTTNNLSNLLAQVNHDPKEHDRTMFKMYLYQDDDASDYDLVLVEYLTLKRNNQGVAQRHHWCLTFGVSSTTKKNAAQLYQLLRAEIQQQMKNDPSLSFWYVYLDNDTFTSKSPFDQIVQLLFADKGVQKSGEQREAPYAAYQQNFGAETTWLHRFQIQSIT